MAQYNKDEIARLREGGRLLGGILRDTAAMARPGVTPRELDAYAEEQIRATGGVPSFKHYTGGGTVPFPSTLCVSVNDAVVHGLGDSDRPFVEGDIVGFDIGMRYKELCTDTAVTVPIGNVSPQLQNLMTVTKEALHLGIEAATPGARVKNISKAIQQHIEAAKYGIVRDLVGHGVGREVHEEPEIPNFVVRGPIGDRVIEPGLVIAIEPMVTLGGSDVKTLDDHWTVVTVDGLPSAHFEHSIAVTEDGPVILTDPDA